MIVFNIDVMLARRKMSLTELSHRVGITMANLSILKTGKARAVRVDTLNKLCLFHLIIHDRFVRKLLKATNN